jgi:RNA polymerase-binding transcription factor DksA
MTQAVLSRYRDLLHRKIRELRSPRHGLDGITVIRCADTLEEAQYKLDRDLAIVSLNHESSIVRGVAMGLRRIEQRKFGVCTNCGGDISRRRLDAVPWTPLCTIARRPARPECCRLGTTGSRKRRDDAHGFTRNRPLYCPNFYVARFSRNRYSHRNSAVCITKYQVTV